MANIGPNIEMDDDIPAVPAIEAPAPRDPLDDEFRVPSPVPSRVATPELRHEREAHLDPAPGWDRHSFAPEYSITEAIRDMNGAQGFSEDKAAIGTISRDLYLQVTPGCVPPAAFQIGTDPFMSATVARGTPAYRQAVVLFLWANYRTLVESTLRIRREDALFLAFLRLNIVMAGGVCANLSNRALYVDEYHVATPTLAQVDFAQLRYARESIEFINDTWLQLVALLRHVFITRGHHFKQEYKEMIDRTWAATTIAPPQNLTIPAWDILFRAGMHCFGIRGLQELTVWGKANGTLAKSFITRFEAAPAGSAPTRTGWAAMQSMKRAPWWHDFYAVYKAAVDALEAADARASGLGLRAHVNAKLFNWDYTHQEVGDREITVLAPLILGFLDTLDDGEAIKNQKAITKRGEGGVAVRQAFSTVLNTEARNARHMESVKQFLQQITVTRPASS